MEIGRYYFEKQKISWATNFRVTRNITQKEVVII